MVNDAKRNKWITYNALTLNCYSEFTTSTEVELSPYGGRMDLDQQEAIGFLYVKRIGGQEQEQDGQEQSQPQRWSFVDPDGYLFLSCGVNSVKIDDDKEAIRLESFETEFDNNHTKWARRTYKKLVCKWGFNTLGCWSDYKAFIDAGTRVPYCPRWSFLRWYARKRPHGRVIIKPYQHPVPVFDPEFESFCDNHAKALLLTRDDPWLLGHFSDNELPLRSRDLLQRYLSQPVSDPGYLAASKWLEDRGKTRHDITESDNQEFCTLVIDRYFRIVSTAIRKYDPNHLFLGSRFNASSITQDFSYTGCGPWVDVVSINYYKRFTPEQELLTHWSKLADRPILITEFYAKGEDAPGCDNEVGAGFTVPSQKERGIFYEHYTMGLLQNPNIVGWHWFRYADEDQSNMGICGLNFEPYRPLVRSMQRINTNLYPLSDFLLTTTTTTNSSCPKLLNEPEAIETTSDMDVEDVDFDDLVA